MRTMRERELAPDLGLSLDPDGASDFNMAMVNVDTILSAIATGTTDPYWGSWRVAQQVVDHVTDEQVASDLYRMWSELNDLLDFTADGSDGERGVQAAIRDAAREWGGLSRDDENAVRDYLDRWAAKRNLALWRDRLGGRTFDHLNAAGWFTGGGA